MNGMGWLHVQETVGAGPGPNYSTHISAGASAVSDSADPGDGGWVGIGHKPGTQHNGKAGFCNLGPHF